MKLEELDEWLFRGLGGIVNMLVRRIGFEEPFNRRCYRIIQHEVQRLVEVREQVCARQAQPSTEESPFCVIDTWFIRSYEGINHWLARRSQEGPAMDSLNLNELQAHITRMQEIIDNERARRNKDHGNSAS